MTLLPERIKYLRQSKGLTQKESGEAVVYDQSRVAKWESGKLEPNSEALIALSEFFYVSIEYLFGLEYD